MKYTTIANAEGHYLTLLGLASARTIQRQIENMFVWKFDQPPFTITEFEA